MRLKSHGEPKGRDEITGQVKHRTSLGLEMLHVAYKKTPRVLLTLARQYSWRDQRPSSAVVEG